MGPTGICNLQTEALEHVGLLEDHMHLLEDHMHHNKPSWGPRLIFCRQGSYYGLFLGKSGNAIKNLTHSKVSKHCILHRHVICKYKIFTRLVK